VVGIPRLVGHTGLAENHFPLAEEQQPSHGPDPKVTSLPLHQTCGRSRSRHTEDTAGTGGSERCEERQGKLNYKGERRLLRKGGRKATDGSPG